MRRSRRLAYAVVAVMVGHVILISAQVVVGPDTTLLGSVVFGAFAESQRLVASTVGAARGLWDGYGSIRTLREENRELRGAVAQLELRVQQQRALVQRAHGLERLLGMRVSVDVPTLSARVIAADASPWFRTLTVDRGHRDGVLEDMAVIAPGGIVGRIVGAPSPWAAKVQPLVDRNAAAGARIERTRIPGVVSGVDDTSVLRMEYVSNLEDVRTGDTVLASGTDGIYPPGFAIGSVTSVERGPGLYKAIAVEPFVDVTRLEKVLVVLGGEGRRASAEEAR